MFTDLNPTCWSFCRHLVPISYRSKWTAYADISCDSCTLRLLASCLMNKKKIHTATSQRDNCVHQISKTDWDNMSSASSTGENGLGNRQDYSRLWKSSEWYTQGRRQAIARIHQRGLPSVDETNPPIEQLVHSRYNISRIHINMNRTKAKNSGSRNLIHPENRYILVLTHHNSDQTWPTGRVQDALISIPCRIACGHTARSCDL